MSSEEDTISELDGQDREGASSCDRNVEKEGGKEFCEKTNDIINNNEDEGKKGDPLLLCGLLVSIARHALGLARRARLGVSGSLVEIARFLGLLVNDRLHKLLHGGVEILNVDLLTPINKINENGQRDIEREDTLDSPKAHEVRFSWPCALGPQWHDNRL
jgi:hypothetical protein